MPSRGGPRGSASRRAGPGIGRVPRNRIRRVLRNRRSALRSAHEIGSLPSCPTWVGFNRASPPSRYSNHPSAPELARNGSPPARNTPSNRRQNASRSGTRLEAALQEGGDVLDRGPRRPEYPREQPFDVEQPLET